MGSSGTARASSSSARRWPGCGRPRRCASAGFDGTLTLVGDEPHLPYDRPPLSKQVLAGDVGARPHRAAVAPTAASTASTSTGGSARGPRASTSPAGGCSSPTATASASTGSSSPPAPRPASCRAPRRLAGVHTLRTLDDCLALRADLDAGAAPGRGGRRRLHRRRGGGHLPHARARRHRARGAAGAARAGARRRDGRGVGDLHRDHGVDLRLGVGVAGFEGGDRVEQVRLADGTPSTPTSWSSASASPPTRAGSRARASTLDDGVVCDATTLAAPGVVAAGDVARWPSHRFGELMRVEHWDNAIARASTPPAACWPRPATGGDRVDGPTTRCRGSGPTSTTARSSSPAGRPGADEVRVVDGSHRRAPLRRPLPPGRPAGGVLGMNRPRLLVTYRGWSSAVRRGTRRSPSAGAPRRDAVRRRPARASPLVAAVIDWMAVATSTADRVRLQAAHAGG